MRRRGARKRDVASLVEASYILPADCRWYADSGCRALAMMAGWWYRYAEFHPPGISGIRLGRLIFGIILPPGLRLVESLRHE